jgi:4-oxalocrotonate tautomerase
MPVVRATVVENAITPEQKQQLINRLTDAVTSVYGETMRPYTWVLIDEIKSGQWGIGGHTLTTEEVRAMMAGEPAVAA